MIKVSAPGKIHLLGEHAVVYGKPALLSTVGLRTSVTISKGQNYHPIKKIIEPIVKKELKIQTIPPYNLTITSDIPAGVGLGSSAALSSAVIGALLLFLKVKWDLNLINKLAYEAEKVFHGNPSGADNKTVIFGGITVPAKLVDNFVLINTGKPKETTKEMVEIVRSQFTVHSSQFQKIFDEQEKLVKKLITAIQDANEKKFIEIIRVGERNLESIGVVSPYAASIIRKIENAGGAAKICGGGGKIKATGVLLAYHPDKNKLIQVAKSYNLPYCTVTLGVEGLRHE